MYTSPRRPAQRPIVPPPHHILLLLLLYYTLGWLYNDGGDDLDNMICEFKNTDEYGSII